MIKNKDQFINIRLSEFPALYHVRKTIYNFIQNQSQKFSGDVLDLGCGEKPYKETILGFPLVKKYVGLDIKTAIVYKEDVKPDYYWDGQTIPFSDNTFDTILATEVLEHCPYPSKTISEIFRVLKKDGNFVFTVPFLFPTHEIPHDEFRYTPFSITRLLKEAGFKNIDVVARGGWRASLSQTIGLFIYNSRAASLSERLVRKLIKPIILIMMWYLYKTDVVPQDLINEKENTLFTGLAGIAKK
ncbi:MAG: class I SAM-dependent methyltransferase [Candidatus Paceibacterota bacterium]|jgi:SAM-dependent methyltransferase